MFGWKFLQEPSFVKIIFFSGVLSRKKFGPRECETGPSNRGEEPNLSWCAAWYRHPVLSRRHPNHQNIKIIGVSTRVMRSVIAAASLMPPENQKLQITAGRVMLS